MVICWNPAHHSSNGLGAEWKGIPQLGTQHVVSQVARIIFTLSLKIHKEHKHQFLSCIALSKALIQNSVLCYHGGKALNLIRYISISFTFITIRILINGYIISHCS